MISWLKYFGLSFFSDRIAKESVKRSMLNFVLGFVLTLVFTFCGVLAANTLPFGVHYKNASQYREFLRGSFDKVNVTVQGGEAVAGEVVCSLPEEGYKLVIDTRPPTALDDFEAYCTAIDGGAEITYESYLSLSEEERGKYEFQIRYTPNELVLTEELTGKHEEYLKMVTDEDLSARFKALVEKKGETPAKEYAEAVYLLYLKAYYPQLDKFVRNSAPLLRNYYYLNYLNKKDFSDYLFVFSDALIGNFRTDGGKVISFYGVYGGTDGIVNGDGADEFVKKSFDNALPMMANVYAMNILRLLPFIALIPLMLALAMWGVMYAIKADVKLRRITTCIKIEGCYLAFSSLVSALAMFVFGYLVSGSVLNFLPLVLLSLVMLARTTVYAVKEVVAAYKSKRKTPHETEEDE